MISNMMLQAQVTEEQLKESQEIKQKREWFCPGSICVGCGNIQ